jgi:hypothetical protein
MSVYWPLTIFAVYKAVKQVCASFHRDRDATKLREFCFGEGLINETISYERLIGNVTKFGAV